MSFPKKQFFSKLSFPRKAEKATSSLRKAKKATYFPRKAKKAMSFPRKAKKSYVFYIKLVAFKSYVHPKKAKNATSLSKTLCQL